MVSIPACHAGDRGSIPRLGDFFRCNNFCRLFADDTLLYRLVETVADQSQLQQDLGNLEQWAAML